MSAKCKKCGQRPAALPDRERPWSSRKSICRECHAKRLQGDMLTVIAAEMEKRRR